MSAKIVAIPALAELNDADRARLMARFVAKVRIAGDCFLWTASVTRNGYGKFGVGGRDGVIASAHRVSYELFKGPPPPRSMVLHRCDVRGCVRPSHLVLGTAKDNTRDAALKGRLVSGERTRSAILTAKIVGEMREAFHVQGERQCHIARRYGVENHLVHMIVRDKRWRPVDESELPPTARVDDPEADAVADRRFVAEWNAVMDRR